MRPVQNNNDVAENDLSLAAVERLVAYEEAKATGNDAALGTPTEAPLREHLASDLACVDLLHRVWPDFDPTPAAPDESPPPKTLGDFCLIRELGRGGMGTVFEAEQISMGRRVALKVLPFAALVQEKSLQRFRNEVRAAAALDHPNIVSVYFIGEERGVHFFAMQLIRGQTLAELIHDLQKSRKLLLVAPPSRGVLTSGSGKGNGEVLLQAGSRAEETPTIDSAVATPPSTQRVEQARISTAVVSRQTAEHFRSAARLGIQAAEALQHAHDLGVLHRDIKPGNLMLDADGKLFVTDFGLARIEADAGITMTGDIVGTLRYMAPEQALAKRVVIDHRADVYSLGATLYELLTLQPAFAETDRSELLKQIAFEEPRPLRKLDRHIPAELETIVLKAMAKNPDERYPTAQQLADDLRAFLENRPIKAKPPTLLNRTTKWSRRHRAMVVGTATILMLLTVGSLISSALLLWERQRTKQTAAESKAVLDFLVTELLAVPKDEMKLDRDVTISEGLKNAEAKIATTFVDQPLAEATVHHAMARTYRSYGKFDWAERHARRALALRTDQLGPQNRNTIESTFTLTNALTDQGKHDEALRLGKAAFELTRRVLGSEHTDTIFAMQQYVWLVNCRGNLTDAQAEQAQKLCEEALELSRRHLGPENIDTIDTMHCLALLLHKRGHDEACHRLLQQTFELSRRTLGTDSPLTLFIMANMVTDLEQQGRGDEANQLEQELLEAQRRVFGIDHTSTLQTMSYVANAYSESGKLQEARQLYEKGLAASVHRFGPDDSRVLTWMRETIDVLLASRDDKPWHSNESDGDYALKLCDDGLELCRRLNGPAHTDTLAWMKLHAAVLEKLGRLDEALKVLDEIVAIGRRILKPDDSMFLFALDARAQVLNDQGKLEEGRAQYEEILKIVRQFVGQGHPHRLYFLRRLGDLLDGQGNLDEAIVFYDEALNLEPNYIGALFNRADTYQHLGRYQEAIADYERMIAMPAEERYLVTGETDSAKKALHGLAWLLATANSDKFRDGKRAVELATKACELTDYKDWKVVNTLAAAYAEAGDFESAVKWSEKAVELAPGVEDMAKHLDSFRSGKPWREE